MQARVWMLFAQHVSITSGKKYCTPTITTSQKQFNWFREPVCTFTCLNIVRSSLNQTSGSSFLKLNPKRKEVSTAASDNSMRPSEIGNTSNKTYTKHTNTWTAWTCTEVFEFQWSKQHKMKMSVYMHLIIITLNNLITCMSMKTPIALPCWVPLICSLCILTVAL